MQDYQTQFITSMEPKGFARSTQRNYLAHLDRFHHFCGKHPDSCGYDDVRAFLHDAIKRRKLSSAYVNSSYAALKFYYETTLCREWNMRHIPRLKSRSFLPDILTPEEVARILDVTTNIKHKALLSTIYSAGLRVSEAVHLSARDIDSANMRIFIRQGKGFKDRNSILARKNLLLLREYWKLYHPMDWLFPGPDPSKPLSVRTVQAVFHVAINQAGIKKRVSVHSLRHAFSTHLLNRGANILQIKELLGHESIQTTSKYLHLTHAQVLGVTSPLDHDGSDSHD